jgi:hypothetical protein
LKIKNINFTIFNFSLAPPMKMGIGKETLRSFALTLRPSAFKNGMILGKAALKVGLDSRCQSQKFYVGILIHRRTNRKCQEV